MKKYMRKKTLMEMTKEDLVEHTMCLEHNLKTTTVSITLLILTLTLFCGIRFDYLGFNFWPWINNPFSSFIFTLFVTDYLFSICYSAHLFYHWLIVHKKEKNS